MFSRENNSLITLFRVSVICFLFQFILVSAFADTPIAQDILGKTKFKGGLAVFIGFKDYSGMQEVAVNGGFLVHGLHRDEGAVSRARKALSKKGVYGLVSVAHHSLRSLPYADNLVNVLVVEDPSVLKSGSLNVGEISRVLCPNGILYVRNGKGSIARLKESRIDSLGLVEDASGWSKFRRQRPAGMDEWTYIDYDGSRSNVSKDRVLGPLGRLRWVAGPNWPLVGHKVGFNRILSGGGRNFYLTMHTTTSALGVKHGWRIVARDAFNGLVLWSKLAEFPPWPRSLTHRGAGAINYWNHTVVDGDLLYLPWGKQFVALGGKTGEVVKTFGPVGTFSRLLQSGRILVRAGASGIRAIHADTGKLLWESSTAGDILLSKDRVFVLELSAKKLISMDLKSGKELWRVGIETIQFAKKTSFLCCTAELILIKGKSLYAFSANDGKMLWQKEKISAFFPAAGKTWMIQGGSRSGFRQIDPQTGQASEQMKIRAKKKRYVTSCGGTRPVATDRFFIGNRPTDFYRWKDGIEFPFQHLRGSCGANITPANGLLYGQANDCYCLPGMFHGHIAMAPAVKSAEGQVAEPLASRLRKGSAFGKATSPYKSDTAPGSEWSHFRRGPSRDNATASAVPAAPILLWETSVAEPVTVSSKPIALEWKVNPTGGGALSQPVIAGGLVFTTASDAHSVTAMDAYTGSIRWRYKTTGRMDTPPTLYKGYCLIGTRDGYVTCLRATDAKVVWRFRAAPKERMIVAFGQLESAWPVVGGVTVVDGKVIVVAGRGNHVDGGVHIFSLNLESGQVVWRADSEPKGCFMCALPVSKDGVIQPARGWSLGLKDGKAIKKTPGIPSVVWDRSWIYLRSLSGGIGFMSYGSAGTQLKVRSGDIYYQYKRDAGARFYGNKYGKDFIHKGLYGVFAQKTLRDKTFLWKNMDFKPPLQVESLILAGQTLCAGGVTDQADVSKGGFIWGLSINGGNKTFELKLKSAPVWEGLSVAYGRLYVSTRDGKLSCFGK
ncbi:MAG: PQQ-binding-like beta-propeller repeat protein [Kiritimatiellae bacterium]|nr:PQQ-binding-like beta-propeller repeat protein [Kiritimatiellia bacterium]